MVKKWIKLANDDWDLNWDWDSIFETLSGDLSWDWDWDWDWRCSKYKRSNVVRSSRMDCSMGPPWSLGSDFCFELLGEVTLCVPTWGRNL